METFTALGKGLMLAGLGLLAVGAVLILLGKGLLPPLPGDVSFQVGRTRVFLPLATSIVLSIVATILLNLIAKR